MAQVRVQDGEAHVKSHSSVTVTFKFRAVVTRLLNVLFFLLSFYNTEERQIEKMKDLNEEKHKRGGKCRENTAD